eukprot:scaffold58479_cov29-Phaeocystis_antarctica.AAC.1
MPRQWAVAARRQRAVAARRRRRRRGRCAARWASRRAAVGTSAARLGAAWVCLPAGSGPPSPAGSSRNAGAAGAAGLAGLAGLDTGRLAGLAGTPPPWLPPAVCRTRLPPAENATRVHAPLHQGRRRARRRRHRRRHCRRRCGGGVRRRKHNRCCSAGSDRPSCRAVGSWATASGGRERMRAAEEARTMFVLVFVFVFVRVRVVRAHVRGRRAAARRTARDMQYREMQ